MEMVTYSRVQELVRQLPETKLPYAYSLLRVLANKEADVLSPQVAFMCLPLEEQTTEERQEWQSGDFSDEY